MLIIRNSEIETIIDYYIKYHKFINLYLNFDYKDNKAYISTEPLTDTLGCLNEIINIDKFDISDINNIFEELIDIIFENEWKHKWT